MATHITIFTTRTTRPDNVAMTAAIRAAIGDPGAILNSIDGTSATGKKSTDWTPQQIAAAQTILDTVAAVTPQLAAQRAVDAYPIELRALVLTILDEINILRTHAAIGLAARTPAQIMPAIRAKAATL